MLIYSLISLIKQQLKQAMQLPFFVIPKFSSVVALMLIAVFGMFRIGIMFSFIFSMNGASFGSFATIVRSTFEISKLLFFKIKTVFFKRIKLLMFLKFSLESGKWLPMSFNAAAPRSESIKA